MVALSSAQLRGLVLLSAFGSVISAGVTLQRGWLTKMADVRTRIGGLGIPYDYDTCVRRVTPGESSVPRAKLGIVAVLCKESMRVYNNVRAECAFRNDIGCRDGLIHFHIYSKCGVSAAEIRASAPNIAACSSITSVQSTVYTDLSWSKAHSEFLEHIIQRYHSLERSLIFTKAKVAKAAIRDVVDIASAVDVALSGKWAYKPLWPTKFSVRFSECPMTCNAVQFGRELCALYKRYTCEADCYSCPRDNEWMDVARLMQESRMEVSRCFFPNPRSTFIASAVRLQSLPVTEYMWLREWLQSWQEDGGGIFRRLMGERLWPVLLGCPEDIHHNTTDGGCLGSMKFPSGRRVYPPVEMIEDGLVHYPALHRAKHLHDVNLHSSGNVYPHLPSPKYGKERLITFVAFYAPARPVDGITAILMAAFSAVLQFHPSARFVLLAGRDSVNGLRKAIASEQHWFAGRLEILSMSVKLPMHFGSEYSAEELRGGRWTHAHRTELTAAFLKTRVLPDPNPEATFGHIVFMPLGALVVEELWGAFDGAAEFALAIPFAGTEYPPQLLILHRAHLMATAAELLRVVGGLVPMDARLLPTADSAAIFPRALTQHFAGCARGRELFGEGSSIAGRILSCPAGGDGSQRPLPAKLLPCAIWGARHTLKADRVDSSPPPTCAPDFSSAKVVVVEPPDGAAGLQVVHSMREYAEPPMGRTALSSM